MQDLLPIRTALLSVADKTGLIEFATQLHQQGIQLYASAGTAAHLASAQLPVTTIDTLTGFTELIDGRVKTLHPKIHAGILAQRNLPTHQQQLESLHIPTFDLVVVNFYPFDRAVEQGKPLSEALELIDIGGPAMLRAAAKNFPWVAAVHSPRQYPLLLETLKVHQGKLPLNVRQQLAMEAFAYAAAYDATITQCFTQHAEDPLPPVLALAAGNRTTLRYGENPHQSAALYTNAPPYFQQLHGKDLSYNNLLDIDAAIRLMLEFDQPTVAILKHTNPCGVASAATPEEAYHNALATDRTSAFGGVVVCNRPISPLLAESLNEIFLEIILAPAFDELALSILKRKKNRRLIQWDIAQARAQLRKNLDLRTLLLGYLLQSRDTLNWDPQQLRVVTHREPTLEEWTALEFGWKVVKHVRSNAIVFAFPNRTAAIGAGQMSRVDAMQCAILKAKNQDIDLSGSIVASDAFFPFPDAIEIAAEAGATAIIQPGGSVRDPSVIEAANQQNLAMVFTGIRHFQH